MYYIFLCIIKIIGGNIMEEVMKNGMSYEEVNNKLLAIASSLNYENRKK